MKTHVLTLAKTFQGKHPRKGELTHFNEGLLSGDKKHTIRSNYDYWAPRIQEVMDGHAKLSIRQWIDKPYKKPGQEIIKELDQFSGIGFAPINIYPQHEMVIVSLEKPAYLDYKARAKNVEANDHLSYSDFWSWFTQEQKAILIYFTKFRY